MSSGLFSSLSSALSSALSLEDIPTQFKTIAQGNKEDTLRVIKKIGKGSYGTVYHVYSDFLSSDVVVKVIDISSVPENLYYTLQNEVDVLNKISNNCENLLCYHYVYTDYENKKMYIVLEYIHGNNLENVKVIDANQLYDWTIMLLKSVSLLHQQQIMHRDIKTENIMVGKLLKLIDYGFSCIMPDCYDYVGSILFMPPEYFTGGRIDYRLHDIWYYYIFYVLYLQKINVQYSRI